MCTGATLAAQVDEAMIARQLQVLLVPTYFDNLGKRFVKSPKVCIKDTGLALD